MKHLRIVVDDRDLFDGEVAEFNWTETPQQVSVTGKFTVAPTWIEQLKGLNQKTEVIDQDNL